MPGDTLYVSTCPWAGEVSALDAFSLIAMGRARLVEGDWQALHRAVYEANRRACHA